jgi:hypothetical protein
MAGLPERVVRPGRVLPAVPPLVTLPIVLIALLKFGEFGVHLFKARDGSSTWYFRFSPKAVLQVRDDGDWCWREGSKRWRREIAPFIARAEALLSERGNDGGPAEARIAMGKWRGLDTTGQVDVGAVATSVRTTLAP